ncbi:MAG: vWA domain-containing protein [Bacteroidota bacterium]
MTKRFCTLSVFLLLLAQVAFAGREPRFQERWEPQRGIPEAECSVPYLNDEIEQKYRSMAQVTNGRFYSAIDCPLIQAIHLALDENLVPGADLVFVIDHTSSMKDDIEEVQRELRSIVERLRETGKVRLGAVSFSDVKSGSEYGYRSLDLSTNYDKFGKFLRETDLVGSVEDIYGAVYRTVDEFSWKSPTKRMIIVIGDEKPATGNETNYTEKDVARKCRGSAIAANLYPVLIDKHE